MCGSWFMGSPFGGMMSWFGRGGMFLPFLLGLGIFVLVVILIITLLRKNKPSKSTYPGNRALQILNERYASGEMPQEEYHQQKKDLLDLKNFTE